MDTKKYCPKCKLPDKEFGPNKRRANGLQVWCKDCLKEYRKSHRQEKSVYNATYRGKNSRSIKLRQRKWRVENKGHQERHYDAYFQTPRGRAAKMVGEIKRRCKENGMPFSITSKDLLPALERGKCEATGMDLDFKGVAAPFMPSVDRIDPQKGYEPGNVRIVVLMFNLAKRNWTDGDVRKMALALAGSGVVS